MISELAISFTYWPWLIASLVTTAFVSVPIYNLFFHPLRNIPGPKLFAATRIPYTRMTSKGHTHLKLLEFHRKYGNVVRISPDEISVEGEHVWGELIGHRKQGASENSKDPKFSTLAKHSLLLVNREDHSRMRRILAHGFSAATIDEQEPIITSYVDLLLQRLRDRCDNGNKALDMTSWYNWTTFDIIGDLAFGESFGCLQEAVYHPWVGMIFKRIKFNCVKTAVSRWGWLSRFILPMMDESRSLAGATNTHLELVQEKLKSRAAMNTLRPDYFHAMTAQEGEKKYTTPELQDTSSLIIVAGSETTATTLSGVTYLLCKHPEILRKLVEEVRTTFQHESDINMHSVSRLEYMLAVLNEGLRMFPPVPCAIPRIMNSNGGIINGYWVPGGTVVGIHQYPLFHNPDYFSQPESFIPERWQNESRFSTDCKKAFQPFSYGPRNCLGRNLAYAEMRLILARIVWNFDLKLANDSDNWIERSEVYLLWHKPELNVHLTPVIRD